MDTDKRERVPLYGTGFFSSWLGWTIRGADLIEPRLAARATGDRMSKTFPDPTTSFLSHCTVLTRCREGPGNRLPHADTPSPFAPFRADERSRGIGFCWRCRDRRGKHLLAHFSSSRQGTPGSEGCQEKSQRPRSPPDRRAKTETSPPLPSRLPRRVALPLSAPHYRGGGPKANSAAPPGPCRYQTVSRPSAPLLAERMTNTPVRSGASSDRPF
jgi:hypothetical protein